MPRPRLSFTVFRVAKNSGPDGSTPYAGLIAGKNGNLYGTTYFGGSDGLGTVFELTPPAVAGGAWTEAVLFSFRNDITNGSHPTDGVIFDEEGNLYGVADGGQHSGGILFQLTPPTTQGGRWTETVLHNFPSNNGKDGTFPFGGLTFGQYGELYGVTELGGASSVGTVFQLKRWSDGTWRESVLYSFADNGIDGIYSVSGVVVDSEGNLYGTAANGGGPAHARLTPIFRVVGRSSSCRRREYLVPTGMRQYSTRSQGLTAMARNLSAN